MEVSFLDLKEREIINVYDGKKLGRIIDVVFSNRSGMIRGIVVPGDKKIFRKADDIFIPLEKIKRIGNDVILVGLQHEESYRRQSAKMAYNKNIRSYENHYEYYPVDREPIYEKERVYERRENKRNNYQKVVYKPQNEKQRNPEQIIENDHISYVRLKPLEKSKYQ